jgi:hypothetical protein
MTTTELNGIDRTAGTGITQSDDQSPSELDLVYMPANLGMDVLAELEALLVEMNVEDRGQAREENAAEERMVLEAGARQVAAMHEQAGELFTQGLYSGFGTAFGGALTAVGGFSAFSEGDEADSILSKWSGLGKALEGTGAIFAAFEGQDAKDCEAEATAAQTAGGAAERRASQASTEMNDGGDDLRALLNHIQAIHDAELAALNAAVFMA